MYRNSEDKDPNGNKGQMTAPLEAESVFYWSDSCEIPICPLNFEPYITELWSWKPRYLHKDDFVK